MFSDANPVTFRPIRTLTIHVAKEQLSRLLAEAQHGDVIVLTDGERRLTVGASSPDGGALKVDLDEDSPELETELLKAIDGPHAPFDESELRKIADSALREQGVHRAR